MLNSKFTRWGLMGSAAVLAMAGAITAVQAYEAQYGDVSIVFDTTVSMGASLRTSDRNTDFLAQSNGGSQVDDRFAFGFFPDPRSALGGLVNGELSLASLPSPTNREGSVNSDDGRLNYDAGDFTGVAVKANHDLQVGWQNYKVFVRAVEFYDFVLNRNDHTNRSDLSDNVTDVVGRDAQLLDAFISGDFTVGDLPLNVRAGKQVISWGEGTFILNGINVINPIDVNAFRRPGAEIKEGLMPVNALFASIGLPIEGTSLAAYYMLDFEPYKIDQPGTPFSGTDVFGSSNLLNTDPHGNIYGTSFLSGGAYSGTFRRNCNTPSLVANPGPNPPIILFPNLVSAPNGASGARQVAGMLGAGAVYDAVIHAQCAGGADPVDYDYAIPTGQLEFIKNTYGDEGIVTHDGAREAESSGQFGLRANWYAEQLGGTEFGFYYQNYHSRLPFVGFRAGSPSLGISTTSKTSSGSSRPVLPLGCAFSAAQNPGALLGAFDPGAPAGYLATVDATTLYAGGATERTLFQNTYVPDPNNYEGVMAGVARAIATAAGAGAEGLSITNRAAATAGEADFDNLSRINCWLSAAQQAAVGVGDTPTLPVNLDGSEFLSAVNNMSVYFQYPEDIQMWGMSFNTVIAGWGVQGEISFRQNAPFQLDTDQLTIASAFTQCASWGVGTSGQSFQLIQTLKQYNCSYNDDLSQTFDEKAAAGIAPGLQDLPGFIRNDMFTASIGTTATFTGSDWWVDGVGADIGILVTELGIVQVSGVEDTWIDKLSNPTLAGPQYQNTGCQGTDLPLGGFLDLRSASSKQCRPTDFSTGLVLLYRLDYNNAFDTGFVLSPQLTYSWDIEGTTPAPYGNFVEDRQAISLGVSGTLNNNFRISASYTNFFSGHINSKSRDQDFASITASYSF